MHTLEDTFQKLKKNINTGWVDHKRTQNEIPKMYEEAA
jgi:hypothetical protein